MATMLPIIMDTSFNRIAVIDDYISFIWATRYYATGDFELVVAVSEKTIGLFVQDYYVVRDDDENVGMIEDIRIQRSEDGDERIIVTGRFLGGAILSRRIISYQITLNDKVSECIYTLLNLTIVSPSSPERERQISNFILDTSLSTTEEMEAQYIGDNLLNLVSNVCEIYGLGFKVTLNSSNQFVFKLYKGLDRTYDQSVNSWVIFSDKYDNLLASEYEENYKDIVNAVFVSGTSAAEGNPSKGAWVARDAASGLTRHEMFVERRDIKQENEMSGKFYALLQEAGKENLTTYTAAFSGIVYFDNVKYKEDVNIGDLVVIQNDRWNLHINTRLIEVIESVSEAGEYSIVPTFGI